MKKFYTLALAAVVALGASAAEKQAYTGETLVRKGELKAATVIADREISLPTVRKSAPAKAVAASDITALDAWKYYGLLNNASGDQEKALNITVKDAATGKLEILLAGSFKLEGTLDAAKGTVSIANKQYLGQDEDGDIIFYIKDMDETTGDITDGASAAIATVGTYQDGSVVFPPLNVWAIGDPENEAAGWYVLSAMNQFGAPTPTIVGSFLENLVYPNFTGEENTNYADVELLVTETSVTVKDPLRDLYVVLGYGEYLSPDLVLDITDPDDVKFGLTNTSLGYYYFNEGWYAATYDEALDPALACKLTKEGDNVTITFPFHSTTLFKGQDFYYGSLNESVLKYTQPSSGIENVAAEEGNGPAVYYNLQGVRVENPRNGVVIRVQNGKATKMLVK
ncbi:MAG: hypothetical protein K2L96_07455 [Muribaculaceae bacterium]|nr:hypothetical protein [Muribaculaceae bacterium]